MSTRRPRPAGEGERRAIGGYYAQYRVSAYLILRALREGALQSIRLADPESGRVDDIQIGSPGRFDAYQVKWGRHPGPLRYRELTAPSRDAPPLIQQLADGWSRLRNEHPGSRVVVHLITNKVPSTADHVPGGDPSKGHTAAFLEQVWARAKQQPPDATWRVPPSWTASWEALRRASGLSPSLFSAFIVDCELEHGWRLPGTGPISSRDEEIFQQDLRHLERMLVEIIADPRQIVELVRDDLLLRLGWLPRLEFRARHEFPVEQRLYEPISPTVARLHEVLNGLDGGYVGLFGNPGSGKSTLLTQTLRTRPERLVRYYAYIPEAQDPHQLRGETETFFHDILLALERSGLRVGASTIAFDRAQLLERFHTRFEPSTRNGPERVGRP